MVTTKTFIASRSFVVIDNHLSKRLAADIREVHVVNRHGRNVRVFMNIYMQATCGLDILMDFRIMMGEDQGGRILFISATMAVRLSGAPGHFEWTKPLRRNERMERAVKKKKEVTEGGLLTG
ncbi:hypothetical protein G5I_02197 [Acromyrmex echinatior]|uniref:Uncharacterized protein n=1 Tax=Acromyrmex echinatior TaxID=103372 RepID=F4W9P3_ACREC|nr:hypothetical protein G5I_02197 [Acromyrmex echinatior]